MNRSVFSTNVVMYTTEGVAASNKPATVFSCACKVVSGVDMSMAGVTRGAPTKRDTAIAEESSPRRSASVWAAKPYNAGCMCAPRREADDATDGDRIIPCERIVVTAGSLGLATDAVGSLAAGVALLGLRGLGISKYWLWASALVARLAAPGVVLPSQRAAECAMIILLGGAPVSLRL